MITVLEAKQLDDLESPELRERALETLESGGVVHLPELGFEPTRQEQPLVDPARVVSLRWGKPRASGRPTLLFYQRRGQLRGGRLRGVSRRQVKLMLGRFADWARDLVLTLLPDYASSLEQEFTTFRPCLRTRRQSLHMDAAILRPTQGRGMLRLFTNVNGAGVPRVWQVGEPFEAAVRPLVSSLPERIRERPPGSGWLLERLGITKGPATAYDHTMRRLRDLMTEDDAYQRSAPRTIVEFATRSSWLAFTDLALHGAVSGQHSLDQTFLLPVSGMRHPERSSLRILERLTGRSLG